MTKNTCPQGKHLAKFTSPMQSHSWPPRWWFGGGGGGGYSGVKLRGMIT